MMDNVCHSAPSLSALGMISDEETVIDFNSSDAGMNSRCRIGKNPMPLRDQKTPTGTQTHSCRHTPSLQF